MPPVRTPQMPRCTRLQDAGYILIHVYTCIYMYIYVYMYVYMYIYTHTHTHTHTHTYVHARVRSLACAAHMLHSVSASVNHSSCPHVCVHACAYACHAVPATVIQCSIAQFPVSPAQTFSSRTPAQHTNNRPRYEDTKTGLDTQETGFTAERGVHTQRATDRQTHHTTHSAHAQTRQKTHRTHR